LFTSWYGFAFTASSDFTVQMEMYFHLHPQEKSGLLSAGFHRIYKF
jgi:hypothetical protein